MATIHIGSDHAGYALKKFLAQELNALGYKVVDHGADNTDSCDYATFAHPVCEAVEKENCLGLLVCGTGIGMSMAANRHPGIRAALCTTELHARMSRRHNDANVLCLGGRITGAELALAIVAAFLENHFEGGRHQRRIDQINL